MESDSIPMNLESFEKDLTNAFIKLENITDEFEKDVVGKNPLILYLGRNTSCRNMNYVPDSWIKSNQKDKLHGCHAVIFNKPAIDLILDRLETQKIDNPIDDWLNTNFSDISLIYTGKVSENKMFVGLFTQQDTNCKERISTM